MLLTEVRYSTAADRVEHYPEDIGGVPRLGEDDDARPNRGSYLPHENRRVMQRRRG